MAATPSPSRPIAVPPRAIRAGCIASSWLALGVAIPAAGQDALDRSCAAFGAATTVAECRLAAGAARMIQPRIAASLWGGNAVAGTASTLGMRIGSLPRLTVGTRLTIAPAELPPLPDRTRSEGSLALLAGGSLDAAVALFSGFSPLPTIGGVLSVDAIARAAYLPLREGRGFPRDAWGLAVGTRIGLLRESFTMPGLSVTAGYSRIGEAGFGDSRQAGTDGFFTGAVNQIGLGAAASKRLGLLDVTAGARYDRLSSDVTVGFRDFPGAPQLRTSGAAIHERWNGYLNLGTTVLIFHGSAEIGLQQAPLPHGLPPGLDLDPVGWYGGVAFRVSI